MNCRKLIYLIAGASTSLVLANFLAAQAPPQPETLQQKIAQIQQQAGNNKDLLRSYQWIETTTITVDGKERPPRISLCRYGADGTLQKTPMSGQNDRPGEQDGGGMPSRGRLMRKLIVGRKKKEIEKEVAEIRSVAKLYTPLDRTKLKDAFAAGDIAIENADGETIVVRNYAKKGDELSLSLSPSTRQIERLSLKTYLESPKDKLIGDIQFSRLSNGARCAGSTSIDAPSKNISIAIVNSNYSKIVE
jgi:hypothetical protein